MSTLRVSKLQGISQTNFEISVPSTHKLVISGILRSNNIQNTSGLDILTSDSSGNISIQTNITSSGNIQATAITSTQRLNLPTWTTSTRPSVNLVNGIMGFNSEKGIEVYTQSDGWMLIGALLKDGLTPSTAAISASQIMLDYPNSPSGVYWIDLPTVGPTQTYCILDPAINGGGWMMMMKATRGATFQYSSNYWTTANTLNVNQTNRNDGDAKFEVMNRFAAKDMLALWPDLGQGGCVSVAGYPFIWLQNNFFAGNRVVPITFWNTVDRYFLGDANAFCGIANFSTQTDVRFYGFNYRSLRTTGDQARTRWGFGWNENGGGLFPNGNEASPDVVGGIGMQFDNTTALYSAGDFIACCQTVTGINRTARVELYVR
jgi:hypothetical protein